MAKDLWLPKGFALYDGSKIYQLLFWGEEWQIYETNGSGNILIVQPKLAKKWVDVGFIDASLLVDIQFGTALYRSLISQKKYALDDVESGKSPHSKVDAIAFSIALKESRKLSNGASFHDAIYVEQYSRLLPTWTLTPHVDDEVVLGTWLSGGVVISTESFRRLSNLVGWMSPSDIAEIVAVAGFHVPVEVNLLAKRKPIPRQDSEEKIIFEQLGEQPEEAKSSDKISQAKTFTLPGRPQLEEFFNEHVIDIIFNAEKYQALGIQFPSAIVLHGPPGCGKTFAVERLVEFIDWPSFSIDSNSVGSPYIHETSKKISEVFDKAIDSAPSVIVIDEMESFLTDRSSGLTSGRHHVEEVAEFLRRIPESINNNVLIFAMTNMIDLIDPAILRRGRFDHIIEVGMPSRIEVVSLLASLLEKLPKSDDLNLDSTLDVLTGKPLSDAAFVIREAARLAAKAGKSQLDQDSVISALKSLPKDKEDNGKRIGFVRDSKT
jgi:ATPase family associated with various cellular activities (AAA)